MGIFSFIGGSQSPEQKFWRWFENNQAMLKAWEKDPERTFGKLAAQLIKVHPDLTFEFGPENERGEREFVISAGGIKSGFSAVESLYQAAPRLDSWKVTKFRQRRHPLNDLTYGEKSIKASDVHYALYKDGEKPGLVLFFDGYNEEEASIFGNIGYLFLDEALGEYDVETKVGFIEFHGRDSEQYGDAAPLEDLAAQFDAYYENQKE